MALCYFRGMENRQTDKKPRNRKRVIIWRTCGAAFFVLALAFFVIFPAIVESLILNRLAKMGFENPRLKVRSVGFTKLDIQSVTAGNPENPDIEIPTLSIDFSLPGLLKGKIKKIEISGMKLSLAAGDGGWRFKGLKTLPGRGRGGNIALPFADLTIHSSTVNVTWQGKKIMLPFDFRAVKTGAAGNPVKKSDNFSFSGTFFPYGEHISLNGAFNPGSGCGNISLEAEHAKLHRYFADFPEVVPFFFESTGKIRSDILLDSWEITNWHVFLAAETLDLFLPAGKVSCDLSLDFKIGAGFKSEDILLRVGFKNVNGKDLRIDIPFDLKVNGENLNTLKFELADLKLREPAGITFKNISGTVTGLPGKLKISGIFSCDAVHRLITKFFPGIKAEGNMTAAGDFRVNLSSAKSEWDMTGKSKGTLSLTAADENFRFDNLSLNFSFFSIGGEIISAIHLASAAITGKDGLRAEGVDINFPYRFPFSPGKSFPGRENKTAAPGRFNIKKLQMAELVAGEITGDITQEKAGFNFSGLIHTPVKGLSARFTGSFGSVDAEPGAFMDIRVDSRKIDPAAKFGSFHPALTDYKISGILSAAALFSMKGGEFKSSALLKLEQCNLETLTGSVKCSGITGEIKMSDLTTFTSEFSQQIAFTGVDIGGLQFNSGKLVFRIENPEVIFVEEGEFAFCDGKVLVNPFRYDIGKEDFKVTLFCDRIDFDKMVNIVMGKEVAFGDAELNGILPVKVSGGIPVFSDGYLYSTPGVGGNVKFEESKAISGGVLLVEEAMKDFNYDWIKLRLNTAEERLNMVVLLNGTPAHKLPLTYDGKTKDIVRDLKKKPGLTLKGLLLELHFKDIDLKELLQGSSKIYSTREKKGEK